MVMTLAELLVRAKRFVCPVCHAPAGRPCRKRTPFATGVGSFTGGPMKTVHRERIALALARDRD